MPLHPNGVNAAWTVGSALFVLLMQAGFALLTCGLVRRKNATHLMMLTFSQYVFASLAYYAVGYAFAFGGIAGRFLVGSGHWGLVGGSGFFARGLSSENAAVFLFEAAVMQLAGYIIVGAVCERITFWAFVAAELFVGALLYPVFACWVWGGGWLSQLGGSMGLTHGYVDFAGSTVVHALGGFSAMALALILGPRIGKFGRGGMPRPFPAHNIVFVVIGTVILLVGWSALTAGATFGAAAPSLSIIAVNTNLAAAAGAASAMLVWQAAYGKPDVSVACNGMLAGLVAISAACAFVGPSTALVIGALAGILVCGGVLFNERTLRVDDPCGSIAVHGYCGWFGAVALGVFADGRSGVIGLIHGGTSQFLVQLIGATVCAAYAFAATYCVFRIVDAVRPIRVDAEVELEGLDLPEFGLLAYPEDDALPG